MAEVKVPEVGESITEVFIGSWLKQAGETVEKDEPLVEIETDKATLEVPAPVSGVLSGVTNSRAIRLRLVKSSPKSVTQQVTLTLQMLAVLTPTKMPKVARLKQTSLRLKPKRTRPTSRPPQNGKRRSAGTGL